MKLKNKAVFLDRDGIINEDTGYVAKPHEVTFIDGIFDFCTKVQQKGYLLIVITNQSGVARGYFSENDVDALHTWMKQEFAKKGVTITHFYYCPYHKDGLIKYYKKDSDFRKPNPGMVLLAAKEYNIDINKSVMIGDKYSDRIKLEGLKSFIIKSKYTTKGYDFESIDQVLDMI